VTASYDKNSAIVLLPPVGGGRLHDRRLRSWLAQADIEVDDGPREILHRITNAAGLPYPQSGLAALRMWGQTGDRPTVWIAGADPVYLEPQLDRLCVHAFRRGSIRSGDLGPLFDHLQSTLAEGTDYGFARLGSCGYLRSNEGIATAALPAYVVDGESPDEYLPSGEAAAGHRKLISEVEMALHEHEVNQRRVEEGQQPVNSLWLWGGGRAPEKITRPQPPLYSDDPLLAGYWESATALVDPWPGSIDDCIQGSVAGFVAVVPRSAGNGDVLEMCLTQLQKALSDGRLGRVVALFRDGIRADIRRSHAVRFWRRNSALLDG
jgi:hypothetical protein